MEIPVRRPPDPGDGSPRMTPSSTRLPWHAAQLDPAADEKAWPRQHPAWGAEVDLFTIGRRRRTYQVHHGQTLDTTIVSPAVDRLRPTG